MKIDGRWHIHDEVSGLMLSVVEGERLDRLHIEFKAERIVDNRDFWFTKDGQHDGTGSGCGPMAECALDDDPTASLAPAARAQEIGAFEQAIRAEFKQYEAERFKEDGIYKHASWGDVGGLLAELASLRARLAATEALVMAQVSSHWFAQGGASQFGDISEPENADGAISAILTVVRARLAEIADTFRFCEFCDAEAAPQGNPHHMPVCAECWSRANLCDVRACVNPAHLFVGDAADNMHDCQAKGRHRYGNHHVLKTHCPKGHPYAGDNLYVYGGSRRCRACHADHERRARANRTRG